MRGLATVGIAIVVAMSVACGGGDYPDPTPKPTERVQTVQGARTDATPVAAASARPAAYTVVSGDTLSDIATRFATTVGAILAANTWPDPDVLEVGQS